MTTAAGTRDIRPGRQRVSVAVAIGLCMPGAVSVRLAALSFLRGRREVPTLMRDGLRTDYAGMTREAA